MKSIIHISNEERHAAILMSEIKAMHHIPASIEDGARTIIEYGDGLVLTMAMTMEEHYIIVSSWRSSA